MSRSSILEGARNSSNAPSRWLWDIVQVQGPATFRKSDSVPANLIRRTPRSSIVKSLISVVPVLGWTVAMRFSCTSNSRSTTSCLAPLPIT